MKYKFSRRFISYNAFLFVFMSLILLPYAHASSMGFNTIRHDFSVRTGGTRIIYPLSSVKGESLSVTNPQDYPVLVQTQIKGEDKHSSAPFVVTPPLFRLDAGMQGRVRVIRTGGNFPQDRESLQWLCVTAVPPKQGDIWDNSQHDKKNNMQDVNIKIQLSVGTCIKLLVRPDQLKQKPEEMAGELIWRRNGQQLQVNNPTPFYMNFKSVSLGNKNIDLSSTGSGNYVAPFANRSFSLPVDMAGSSAEINWQIINDLGSESRVFKANV
ncbi:fimbria/pilus periplasmic chaperone [Yersinia proxima]|uniref:fimbria/pilus periplasmic chaperone n=1 Tax=Yersinia proxima TaxID=2890316 RepID=UPI0009842CBD|nr:fimbria/pilus periplasmic chaperone [Yersinia proxima]